MLKRVLKWSMGPLLAAALVTMVDTASASAQGLSLSIGRGRGLQIGTFGGGYYPPYGANRYRSYRPSYGFQSPYGYRSGYRGYGYQPRFYGPSGGFYGVPYRGPSRGTTRIYRW